MKKLIVAITLATGLVLGTAGMASAGEARPKAATAAQCTKAKAAVGAGVDAKTIIDAGVGAGVDFRLCDLTAAVSAQVGVVAGVGLNLVTGVVSSLGSLVGALVAKLLVALCLT